jgi:hypothetical protein
VDGYALSCDARARLYCVQTTRSQRLLPIASGGKRLWVTSSLWSPQTGISSAAALCNAEKPSGVGAVEPLLAVAAAFQPAAAALEPRTLYVRPDGQPLGTGAELAAGRWRSGPWQQGNGAYLDTRSSAAFWVGASAFGVMPADPGSTCQDWTSNLPEHRGLAGDARFVGGGTLFALPCNSPARVACFEL